MIQNIKLALIKLAEYYRFEITQSQLEMYADDLSCLSQEQLIQAIQTYRKNPDNKFFPMPGALISIITPLETELDIGRIVSGKIMTAISKFGSYNASEAKGWMGEVAWEVVQFQGGWKSLCELSSEAIKSEQPRWRDLAMSICKRSKLGKLDEAPALPRPNQEFKSIGEIIKSIGEINDHKNS